MASDIRIVRTRKGARMEQDGLIVSEILDHPGATDSLFDVLAASVAALARGDRMAMLGFAGGGVVAPLRAMGYGHPIEACDLSLQGEPLFRELSAPWCGDVRVDEAEASAWLRAKRRAYDVILEDLSARVDGEITKPAVSLDVLPALMKRKLAPRGIAVMNVLPVPGRPWTRLLPYLAEPFAEARVMVLEAWENRVLILGDELDAAAVCSRQISHILAAVGSDEAGAFSLRTVR
ncbi:MAG: hypothetical protein P1V36_10630 [Planctomycetota bacterium]|nr:hypothetical protein [Planctomycetota bacterium]